MSKLGVVIYYWIAMLAACFVAKTMGFADDNATMIEIFIILTVAYVAVMALVFYRRRKKEEAEWKKSVEQKEWQPQETGVKKKKKKKRKK